MPGPKLQSALDYERDIVETVVGELFAFRSFPSAVIMAIDVNALDHVSLCQGPVSQRSSVKWVP